MENQNETFYVFHQAFKLLQSHVMRFTPNYASSVHYSNLNAMYEE